MKKKEKLPAILAALISGIALFVFVSCEQDAGASQEESYQPLHKPVQTGITVDYSNAIFIYVRNQTFEREGLIVRKVGTKEGEPWEEETTDYTLGFPEGFTQETVTGTPGLKIITVTNGEFKASYNIQVNNSDKILQSIAITTPPANTVYEIGQNPDFTGMVVSAVYTGASGTETKPLTVYTYSGYDKTRRGTQTIIIKANQKAAEFNARVKIPASAEITANEFNWLTGNQRLYYRASLIKGRALPDGGFPEDFKITVKANGVTTYFTRAAGGRNGTEDCGGLEGAVITGYNPNQTGSQTLTCTVDDASITFPVYVLDVEPHVFFDYGYWRHAGNPEGGATVTGGTPAQYTVPVNTELVITPIVFAMNTETPSYSWTCNAPLVSGTGLTDKYLKIKPTAEGTYTATVTVNAGNATGMTAATTIVCTPARTLPQPAPVVSDKFNSPLPPVMNAGNHNTGAYIRNFAPGQFTKGGSGYGWSLGAIGGYFIWKLQKQAGGDVLIVGNPFGNWSEAGIVWVSADDNHNGLPDDTWYELQGSEDFKVSPNGPTTRLYGIRFIYAGTFAADEYLTNEDLVYWVDSKGRGGRFNSAEWSTNWGVAEGEGAWVEFAATLLRDGNHIDDSVSYDLIFDWGYVDSMNRGAAATGRENGHFYLSDAIRRDGAPANLEYIDFVKVQTACWYYGNIFGEISTEINWGEGLGTMTNFPSPE